MRRRSPFAVVAVIAVLAALLAVREGRRDPVPGRNTATAVPEAPQAGGGGLLAAVARHARGVQVEGRGRVARLLPDDTRGSRHQRFLLQLDDGTRVLVAHNIDLAPRVDGLDIGDAVDVRGEYLWNPRGGVLHWTHRDPRGRRAGGWLRHDGRTYR